MKNMDNEKAQRIINRIKKAALAGYVISFLILIYSFVAPSSPLYSHHEYVKNGRVLAPGESFKDAYQAELNKLKGANQK